MRRRILRLALVAVGCWIIGVVVVGVLTLRAADDARANLRETRRDLSIDALVDGRAVANLEQVGDDLRRVRAGARSPVLAPLRLVPGVSRQIRTAEALSTAGRSATAVGVELLEELSTVVEGSLPEGPERVELIDRISGLLAEGRAELASLDLGPDGPLVPALADARTTARDGLRDLRTFLVDGEAASRAVRDLLVEGRYLVLAANNAEMRAGSGMFLQVGLLEGDGGSLDVGDLVPAKDILLPPGQVVAGSSTYDDLWGFLQPTVDWRNLALSPRFDVTAPLAARMWEGLGRPRPTGVMAVDPYAIRAVLRATGPVEVDGRPIGPDDVVPFLLNGQYDVFDDLGGYDEYVEEQAARRELLGGLVDAMFDALGRPGTNATALLEELRDAVRGRHLLAWSGDPEVQAGWAAAGMAGDLETESTMVALSNRGVNKLDPFIDVSVALDVDESEGEWSTGVMDIVVRNATPEGEVPYVGGPAEGIQGIDAYGDYAGILTVILPGVAREARIDGEPSLLVADPDGPVLTVASFLSVDRGAERRVRVTFEVPTALESVRIEPSARPRPVEWRIGERTRNDRQHHRVPLRGSP